MLPTYPERRPEPGWLEGLKPEEIEWVWMVEARRRATPEEIRQLCAGKTGAYVHVRTLRPAG